MVKRDRSVEPSAAGLFGSEFHEENDEIVIIGVPWEATASYGRGCSRTPELLPRASHQLDFFAPRLCANFGHQVGLLAANPDWLELNTRCIALADPIISAGGPVTVAQHRALDEINFASRRLNQEVAETTRHWRGCGKLTGILGGDHSAPLGHLLVIVANHPGCGVLHIDAHHDLRKAYEGFTYSHASIMYNLLQESKELGALVSVGIRDFCEDEYRLAQEHDKVTTFYDHHLKAELFAGRYWLDLCQEVVAALPQQVYVSFDIDGLERAWCPHTGTPVPGGLSFDQAIFLLNQLVSSGRQLVGFDLCEVASNLGSPQDEWDLNVAARLLWQLCLLLKTSNA